MRALVIPGLQPAAPAVAFKTWHDRREAPDLDDICMLVTARVQSSGIAERLVRFLSNLFPRARIDPPRTIADGLVREGGRSSAAEAAREWLDQDRGPIVFFADPGPKYVTMSVTRQLSDHVVFVHNDTEHLYVRTYQHGEERSFTQPLSDIGLEHLLALYDLRAETGSKEDAAGLAVRDALGARKLPGFVVAGLRFPDRPDVPVFHLAFEKKGRLYGLVHIASTPDSKQVVRAIAAVKGRQSPLNGLQAQVAILSAEAEVLSRARSAGIQAVSPGGMGLDFWMEGLPSPPGGTLGLDTQLDGEQSCPGSIEHLSAEAPDLVTWVGIEEGIGATMIALCTHRPRSAFLLFDRNTPAAREMARRILDQAARLPAGTITCVPSDGIGSGVRERLTPELRGRRVRADLTAGRSSQGCALAHMPDVELWFIRGDRGIGQRLDDDTTLPCRAPEIVTQARIVGGPLLHDGTDGSTLNHAFFSDLTAVLASAVHQVKTFSPLPQVKSPRGELAFLAKNAVTQVKVRINGRSSRGKIRPRGGFWFEDLVASRLASIGADEVRIGLKFRWPRDVEEKLRQRLNPTAGGQEREPFKDEIDVVARFGHRFCVVSCKTGEEFDSQRGNAWSARLTAEARATRGVTVLGIDRFALPIVAHPRPYPAAERDAIERSWNVLLLDMVTLSDDDALRAALDRGWRARSTVS